MGKDQPRFLIIIFSLAFIVTGILNTRFELFELDGILGVVFYGISLFYLPAHMSAMVITNAADPPDLWGVILCYSIQAFFAVLIGKHLFLRRKPEVDEAIKRELD